MRPLRLGDRVVRPTTKSYSVIQLSEAPYTWVRSRHTDHHGLGRAAALDGTIDIHGYEYSRTWTRIAAQAEIGDSTLRLQHVRPSHRRALLLALAPHAAAAALPLGRHAGGCVGSRRRSTSRWTASPPRGAAPSAAAPSPRAAPPRCCLRHRAARRSAGRWGTAYLSGGPSGPPEASPLRASRGAPAPRTPRETPEV